MSGAPSPLDTEAFLTEVKDGLGASGDIADWGVSRVLRTNIDGRYVQVGSNGSDYWISVELGWTVPQNACVPFAAPESYSREKYLEEGPPPPKTGDVKFDDTYFLLGDGAGQLAQLLSQRARAALLAHSRIHPDVTWLEPVSLAQRLVIRAAPPLYLPERDRWAELGEPPFTAAHVAEAIRVALSLASALDASQVTRAAAQRGDEADKARRLFGLRGLCSCKGCGSRGERRPCLLQPFVGRLHRRRSDDGYRELR